MHNNNNRIFNKLKQVELPSKELLTRNLNRFMCYEENQDAKKNRKKPIYCHQ